MWLQYEEVAKRYHSYYNCNDDHDDDAAAADDDDDGICVAKIFVVGRTRRSSFIFRFGVLKGSGKQRSFLETG